MKIFLAYPFSQFLDENNVADEKNTEIINLVIDTLEKNGDDVFSAQRREKFGLELMPPHQCTYLDFEGIKESDVIVAYPGSPISGGVHIELGWASALNKPIVLLLKKDEEYSPLIIGLHTKTSVFTMFFEENVLECIPYINEALAKYKSLA